MKHKPYHPEMDFMSDIKDLGCNQGCTYLCMRDRFELYDISYMKKILNIYF